jgi:hypothetical protein
MIDKRTGTPLRVATDRKSSPHLIVALEQVPNVKQVLDAAAVQYWVDDIAVSMSGGPMLTVINFEKTTNPDVVQSALDRAP